MRKVDHMIKINILNLIKIESNKEIFGQFLLKFFNFFMVRIHLIHPIFLLHYKFFFKLKN
jgi:hypothetical protein